MKKVLKDIKVCLIRHKSALHILAAYLDIDWPIKDIRTLNKLRIDELNGSKRQTFAERLKYIEQLGYWAFCRKGDVGELHYWLGGRISDDQLISVFAHELTHLAGQRSERTAVRVAEITKFACELARGVRHE